MDPQPALTAAALCLRVRAAQLTTAWHRARAEQGQTAVVKAIHADLCRHRDAWLVLTGQLPIP